ncbi:MAG TPA: BamA/TamA family outer membrane protein [Chitinophagaceae bacterium]|nr:BamA/TamA family outer membrane protein [Chitinophagaceae bacterium]
MKHLNRSVLVLSALILTSNCFSQDKTTGNASTKQVIAGPEYKKPRSFQKLWGRNRRIEWSTPVNVPFLWLDKVDGGLKPSETSGGNETKGLKLKSASGKEYALRSINKSRNDVTPKAYKGTFVEDLIQDGVSMSHPYGAFALTVMEQHAGIYHTEPRLVYLPKQPALDSLNEKYGDDLYMIEQRLSCDWSEADNLGNFKDFFGTDEVVEKLKEDNDNRADQYLFAKARLFDMLLADWDRHEDQWKWGKVKSGEESIYIPVPRDRDQVFYTHNGFLIDRALPAIGNGYMQNFDHDSKDISRLNYEERNIDPFFTNQLSLDDWTRAAKDLQQSLTDRVIEQSIQQLPPEIVAVSGKELIEKLKSRRGHLVKYATQYYHFLAREVEITGSKKSEFFEIRTNDAGDLLVKLYALDKDGKRKGEAFYSRAFKAGETKKIRIFGIDGNDVYDARKHTDIQVSIIGGPQRDSIVQEPGSGKIFIYDNEDNALQVNHARLHLSPDTTIHTFNYYGHEINKRGLMPSISFTDEDQVYVGIGYKILRYKWKRPPFAAKHFIDLHYSLSQKSLSLGYTGEFPNLINKWNLSLSGNFDAIRWTNFFGLGNETAIPVYRRNFYQLRTREWFASAGINRQFGRSTVSIGGFFQSVKIIDDKERYVAAIFRSEDKNTFDDNKYAGIQATYSFLNVNDSIVPTRGISFLTNASLFRNISKGELFQKYMAKLQFYIPFGNKFSLAVKAGASTIRCNDEVLNSARFYEHSVIGGAINLRGYRWQRFWGQSAFFNNNELRYITNIKTHWLNAKTGLILFFDAGRVWMPGENSTTLHTSYGPAFLFAPFNALSLTFSYGMAKESKIFQVGINTIF